MFVALGMIRGTADIAPAVDLQQLKRLDQTTIRFAEVPQVTPDVFVTMTASTTNPVAGRVITYTITVTSAGLAYLHTRGVAMMGTDFSVYLLAGFYGTPVAVTVLTPPTLPDPATDFRCFTHRYPGVFQIECGVYNSFFASYGLLDFPVRAGTSVQIQVTANAPSWSVRARSARRSRRGPGQGRARAAHLGGGAALRPGGARA